MGRVSYPCPECERRTSIGNGCVRIDASHESMTSLGRVFHMWRKHGIRWATGAYFERQFSREWGDLASYNGEKARGLVHKPSLVRRMREKQHRYNEQVLGVHLQSGERA